MKTVVTSIEDFVAATTEPANKIIFRGHPWALADVNRSISTWRCMKLRAIAVIHRHKNSYDVRIVQRGANEPIIEDYKIAKRLVRDEEEKILSAPMLELANFSGPITGIGLVIICGEVAGYGPCIKVSNTPGKFNIRSNFVVSVSKNPKVLTPISVRVTQDKVNNVTGWIKLNYGTLKALWKMFETKDSV